MDVLSTDGIFPMPRWIPAVICGLVVVMGCAGILPLLGIIIGVTLPMPFLLSGVGRKSRPTPWKLHPFLSDPRKRFGLSPLYQPYNLIAWLVLLGGIGGYFIYISQSAKGNFVLSNPSINSAGQAGVLIIIGIAFSALAVGPGIVFRLYLNRAREEKLHELSRQLGTAANDATRTDYWRYRAH